MFDEETEQLAGELGLEVAFPPASLRHRLDSKIVTTQLGNDAGVPSVPNTMGRANDYAGAMQLARGAGLGDDLVVQTPYGDSGQTTFFIADEGDWKAHERKIVGQDIKVMRRIDPRECAIEGVITRHGTLVGPLMAELTGFPELTPYDGGWCGNDVFPDVLTEGQRALAHGSARSRWASGCARGLPRLLRARLPGGRGVRRDVPGRAQPAGDRRVSITNVTAVAYGDMPLFLFHLLEFMDVDYEIDVDELNERWAHPGNIDDWTQFILKQTDDRVERITEAPASGVWRMGDDRAISYARRETDWHTVADEDEAFYLRIAGPGQLPLPRSRSGHHGHARPVPGRRPRADRPGARAGSTACRRSSPACRSSAEAPPIRPEPFGFKML